MKKALSLVLVLIMALSLAACGGVSETETTSEISTQPETLVVPNVVGMDKDEAVKLLEGMGFETKLRAEGIFVNLEMNPDYKDKDNEVVFQDSNPGSTRPLKTVIAMRYVSATCFDKYEENPDGTITITRFGEWYSPEGILTVPKTYEGKTISCIKDEGLPKKIGSGSAFAFGVKAVRVPKDVKVEVDIDYDLERY